VKDGMVNGAIKIGPLWNRTLFDPAGRVVKRRGRAICRFEEIKALRLREYINRDEEEQLLNAHPEVQKAPREAELWVETQDGQTRCVATLEQAGLLLEFANEAARQIGVPIHAERCLIAISEPTRKPGSPQRTETTGVELSKKKDRAE
jgi:hypothetical protein